MSLLWNWGSKNLLRRCTPYTSSLTRPDIVPRSLTTLSSSTSTTLSSASSSRIISSSTPLLSYYQTTFLRFKSGMKTHSGSKKRFRVRGSGSIKRPKAGKSHNTGYLRRQRANRLGHSTGIEGKKIEQRVRKLLGVFNG